VAEPSASDRPPRRPVVPVALRPHDHTGSHSPARGVSPAVEVALPVGAVADLSRSVGNRVTTDLVRRHLSTNASGLLGASGPIQRVPVSYPDAGETLYEDPPAPGASAASKQFDPTPYSGGTIQYDIARQPSGVRVEVRIQFVDQARDERKFIKQGGKNVPNPNFGADTGKIRPIGRGDPRQAFAKARCSAITGAWNHYDFLGKLAAVPAGPVGPAGPVPAAPAPAAPAPAAPAPAAPAPAAGKGGASAAPAPAAPGKGGASAAPAPAAPGEIRLPVTFVATPVFDLKAPNVHSVIRLYGRSTVADRDGAHPVDSGHWYMNTEKNYAGMNLDAIAAHEYGHLIGINDEYFRSDDQTHQMLHRMGGGAKNADKELDRSTVRQMVTVALYNPILDRMNANMATITGAFLAEKKNLTKQIRTAITTSWSDGGIRSQLVKQLEPELSRNGLKRALPGAVDFETSGNLSGGNLTKEAMGNFTGDRISGTILGEMESWRAERRKGFTTTGADGSSVTITSNFSANVTGSGMAGGAMASSGSAVTDRIAGGVPKVSPSTSLISQLEALPAEWSNPGKGLDAYYTPAILQPQVDAVVKSVIAAGAVKRIKSVHELYVRVLRIVQSSAKTSSSKAVASFLDDAIKPRVKGQLTSLGSQIDAEVDAAMAMPAGALASKSAPDPEIRKVADHLYGMLQKQQNPKSYGGPDANPGAGSGGVDVRHSSSSVMSSNDTSKAGHRADLIQPVLAQFNSLLKQPTEDDFRAEVTR
jgi:hypothetical protein